MPSGGPSEASESGDQVPLACSGTVPNVTVNMGSTSMTNPSCLAW